MQELFKEKIASKRNEEQLQQKVKSADSIGSWEKGDKIQRIVGIRRN